MLTPISVETRLPEAHRQVLMYTNRWRGWRVGRSVGANRWIIGEGPCFTKQVTHWLPMSVLPIPGRGV